MAQSRPENRGQYIVFSGSGLLPDLLGGASNDQPFHAHHRQGMAQGLKDRRNIVTVPGYPGSVGGPL